MTVFIKKGDATLSVRQAVKRGLRHFNAEKAYWEREQGIVESDTEYQAWATQWIADNVVNTENNLFNNQLAAYRKATARLAMVQLSVGRPAYEEPTEEVDENGDPIMRTIPAIEPVVGGTVEVPVYDDDGNQIGTETQPDEAQKRIDADDAERAAAQAVIEGTSQEVKDFY